MFNSIISDLHVLIGSIGMISGLAALVFAKGKKHHKLAGNIFFITMLVSASFGLYTAYLKTDIPFSTALFTCFIGFFTLYLVFTSWVTVKRSPGQKGKAETIALIYILAVAIYALTVGVDAALADGGVEKNGAPAMDVGIFYFFAAFAILLALGDLHLILRGGIGGAKRIARHLWRMTMAFIMSVAIVFLGNSHVFPEFVQDARLFSLPLLAIPVLSLIVVMFWSLLKVLVLKKHKKSAPLNPKTDIQMSEV